MLKAYSKCLGFYLEWRVFALLLLKFMIKLVYYDKLSLNLHYGALVSVYSLNYLVRKR